jgi:cobalt-zinc-cadmium efflux system outer membrane protein
VIHPMRDSRSRASRVAALTRACAILLLLTLPAMAPAQIPGHDHAPLPVRDDASLAGTVALALENYPAAIGLDARSREAEAWRDKGRSWLADRPSLGFRYQSDEWGPNERLREYEAGISLPLWNPGARGAVQGLGDALGLASVAAQEAVRWEVAGHLRDRLWRIALARNEHELAEYALEISTRLAETVARRHELGDVALADVLLAQAARLDAQERHIETESALLDAERAWRSVSGLDWRPRFAPESLSEVGDIRDTHPALALANARLESTESAVAVAEKTARTGSTLTVGPRRERPAFGETFDDSIGISLNVPFGGTAHRRVEITAATRVAAEARSQRAELFRALTLALHEAAHELGVIAENLEAATERRSLAERYRQMAASGYEKGEIDLVDLLRSQANEVEARRQVTRLLIERNRQTALYNQAVGELPL